MIEILEKKNCTGCEACVQICPKSCISFQPDEEGFLYPRVDKELCINCGLCEKACPVLEQKSTRNTSRIYAAINRNETTRAKSSSGGIFSLLAEQILDRGGVVFGAAFDKDWNVYHTHIEQREQLPRLMGSKYVQSRIGNTYRDVATFLKGQRHVLFCGTPCQIAGLKLFLRKPYEKLVTVDIICHGVPSPKVWRRYLDVIIPLDPSTNRKQQIHHISFRDKGLGWSNYSFRCQGIEQDIINSPVTQNDYLQCFIKNLFLRPSCAACPAKSFKSGSDITLSDFWEVGYLLPSFNDNKGTSLVMIHTDKGESLYQTLQVDSQQVEQLAMQRMVYESIKHSPRRNQFFTDLSEGNMPVIKLMRLYSKDNLKTKILNKSKFLITRVMGKKNLQRIKLLLARRK